MDRRNKLEGNNDEWVTFQRLLVGMNYIQRVLNKDNCHRYCKFTNNSVFGVTIL